MTINNVWAHTALDTEYPPFISINETDDNKLLVSIRDKKFVAGEDGEFVDAGKVLTYELDMPQAGEMIEKLYEWFNNDIN